MRIAMSYGPKPLSGLSRRSNEKQFMRAHREMRRSRPPANPPGRPTNSVHLSELSGIREKRKGNGWKLLSVGFWLSKIHSLSNLLFHLEILEIIWLVRVWQEDYKAPAWPSKIDRQTDRMRGDTALCSCPRQSSILITNINSRRQSRKQFILT
jgi:hypothetical protein